MSERVTCFETERYVVKLVNQGPGPDGGLTWYVWDVRSTDPWSMPGAMLADDGTLDAQEVLARFVASLAGALA